jgi:hypothetical protein
MRRPKSLHKYQILRDSQGQDSHYFSLGFHYFYTQFYTHVSADLKVLMDCSDGGVETNMVHWLCRRKNWLVFVMGTVTVSEEPMMDGVFVTAFQFVREARFVVVWRI